MAVNMLAKTPMAKVAAKPCTCGLSSTLPANQNRTPHDRSVVTHGGRVLTVSATGRTIGEARNKVYSNMQRISFSGCHFRKDIALTEVH